MIKTTPVLMQSFIIHSLFQESVVEVHYLENKIKEYNNHKFLPKYIQTPKYHYLSKFSFLLILVGIDWFVELDQGNSKLKYIGQKVDPKAKKKGTNIVAILDQ